MKPVSHGSDAAESKHARNLQAGAEGMVSKSPDAALCTRACQLRRTRDDLEATPFLSPCPGVCP